MMEMAICGSCHTLVTPINLDEICPRCGDELNPNAESLLARFVQRGTDTGQRGVPMPEARRAAAEVLQILRECRDGS